MLWFSSPGSLRTEQMSYGGCAIWSCFAEVPGQVEREKTVPHLFVRFFSLQARHRGGDDGDDVYVTVEPRLIPEMFSQTATTSSSRTFGSCTRSSLDAADPGV